jgi:hypothetical protein
MRTLRVALSAVSSLLVGCPNGPPTPPGETSFTTSENISGTNPEAAKFAVLERVAASAQHPTTVAP